MLNKDQLVSIIVPVYGVETYISRCIDSILSQTYINWELLLIDDGSTDNSGLICDKYAENDRRIRVYHKDNSGVSETRNFGLDKALGEYVMFVDADDAISCECIETCVDEISRWNLDALHFCLVWVYPHYSKIKHKKTSEILNGGQFVRQNVLNCCIGGGIYKKSIIDDIHLRFCSQMKLGEDQIFVLNFLKNANRLKYIDIPMYYYYQRTDSAVHSNKSKDMLLSCRYMTSFSREWSEAKQVIDNAIVLFITEMITNKDVSFEILQDIYKSQNVKKVTDGNIHKKIFPLLSKIDIILACYIMSLFLDFINVIKKIKVMVQK